MSKEDSIAKVKILNKEYHIKCSQEDKNILIHATKILTAKINSVKRSSANLCNEKIVVMAALNIARDLIKEYTEGVDNLQKKFEKIEKLEAKITKILEHT